MREMGNWENAGPPGRADLEELGGSYLDSSRGGERMNLVFFPKHFKKWFIWLQNRKKQLYLISLVSLSLFTRDKM